MPGRDVTGSVGVLTLRLGARDLANRARFGAGAPRFAERIWVDPREVERVDFGFGTTESGKVVTTAEWRRAALQPLADFAKLRCCTERWIRGLSWEETGVLEHWRRQLERGCVMDGLRDMGEVVERYERLDRVFATVRHEGRLRTRSELPYRTFRERGGILVHIGPTAEPILGRGGHHRFAMAVALDLRAVPAQIGVVHHDALGLLGRFRPSPRADAPAIRGAARPHTATSRSGRLLDRPR